MPNTREKLIELICNASYDITRICVNRDWCDGCPAEYGEGQCKEAYIADHLIANGVTVQLEWISVKDRLPEKYGRYLALTPGYLKGFEQYNAWLIYYHPESGFYDTDPQWGDIPMDDITHWMPLPQPPKGE